MPASAQEPEVARRSPLKTGLSALRGRVARSLTDARYALHSSLISNRGSRRAFEQHRPALTDPQRVAVAALVKDGIAFLTVEDLPALQPVWERLQGEVGAFVESPRVTDAVRAFPELLARGGVASDAYIIKMYPGRPTFSVTDPLLAFGLHDAILGIVNSYLRLWSKLIYTDVWHTIMSGVSQRIGSQEWHRDPEDRRMVKGYLYFGDVDDGAGPMEYVAGSKPGGRYGSLRPWHPLGGHGARYLSDDEVRQRVASQDRIVCRGVRGTLILCDTDGLHRGGLATTAPRIAATWTYVTPAALAMTASRRFDVAQPVPELAAAAAYALSREA